ncbi:hypothetical protein BUE80_DR004675 [Diplocarpon rosae]|nr:hypothetical protein BUE80_DR004675 [Diplocarpon rosae]
MSTPRLRSSNRAPDMMVLGSGIMLGSFSAASLFTLSQSSQAALPVFVIRYTVHQATLHVRSQVFSLLASVIFTVGKSPGVGHDNFFNLRYTQPPVGLVQFSPPLAPVGDYR